VGFLVLQHFLVRFPICLSFHRNPNFRRQKMAIDNTQDRINHLDGTVGGTHTHADGTVHSNVDDSTVGTGGHNVVTGDEADTDAGKVGLAGGALAGGAIGAAVGGPVGAVVGGVIGSLTGGVAGDAAEAGDEAHGNTRGIV
jgi:hypothetical protein